MLARKVIKRPAAIVLPTHPESIQVKRNPVLSNGFFLSARLAVSLSERISSYANMYLLYI